MKNDMIHGKGVYTWGNGVKFIGVFFENKFVNGMMKNHKDVIYTGEFKDWKPYGKGTFNWPSGKKYKGSFRDGKYGGLGKLTNPRGSNYTGFFKHGKYHGKGSLVYPPNRYTIKRAGQFERGKFACD